MNRHLIFSLAVLVILSTLAIPLRAANKPHAGDMEKSTVVWTNADLEKLKPLGLISIIGQSNNGEESPLAASPAPYVKTKDPQWYAERAIELREELERRQGQLRNYQQALDDARSLRGTTGGINLTEGDVGITPEAGIDILQHRVNDVETKLDALADLARRNDIPPGVLRSQ